MKFLAFGFKRRRGKSTAAKLAMSFVRLHHPKVSVELCSFGDQVKDICRAMYGWGGLQDTIYYENHPSLKEVSLPTIEKSPRTIWEEVGAMGRRVCPKTWIQMAFTAVDSEIAIISDLRDIREVEAIREFPGSRIYRIDRDVPGEYHSLTENLDDFTDWDGVIDNNAMLKDLNFKVQEITDQLIKD